jgi:ABC-type multidrug transport system permease subunit
MALAVMSACGLIIGWRIRGSVLDAIFGYLILLMFAFTLSWVGTVIGLTAPSLEMAQGVGIIWMFPAIYVSSAFVPKGNIPTFLQPIAEWNPYSAVATATRNLFGNHFGPATTDWPATHATLYAVLSCIGMIAVFAPLAVARYRRVASK